MKILAICGSLRRESFNKATLRAVCDLAPPELRIDVRYLHDIPLYNQDELDMHGRPPPVAAFCAAIAAADGIIIATPEYLYSVPGVLKNAIDWTTDKPSVFADNQLTDETIREALKAQILAFREWVRRLQSAEATVSR